MKTATGTGTQRQGISLGAERAEPRGGLSILRSRAGPAECGLQGPAVSGKGWTEPSLRSWQPRHECLEMAEQGHVRQNHFAKGGKDPCSKVVLL